MSIPDDEFLRKFIQQDSKDHPECRYSTATSKNCGSYNGKYSCETIRRVFKRCPNVPPEKIYEKTTTDTGSYDPSTGNSGVLGGGDDPKHHGIDPFARRPPGFPFAPPDIDAVFSQASEDIIAKMEKRLNKFWSDKLPVSKSTNGTTPDLPAPHKPSQSKTSASDLEQG